MAVVPTKRFVYHASLIGVGAALTTPAMAESWAPASLPVIGGHSGSAVGHTVWPSASDPVLQFESAGTDITGRQTGATPGAEEYETIVRKTVTNLNILNRLTASLSVEIKFHYTRRPTPAASRQRDLVDVTLNLIQFVIDTPGQAPPAVLAKPIVLNDRIPYYAGQDFKSFRGGSGPQSIDQLRPYPAHHKHEIGGSGHGGHGQGLIYTALVEPTNQFVYDDKVLEFGKLNIRDLGDIYIGEWEGQPYHQSFTYLRVEFDGVKDRLAPKTAFSGEVVIDQPEDGSTYP